jgi:pantothenate kinase
MERDQLLVMIGIVLSVGSGAIAQWLTSMFIKHEAPDASPRTKRYITFGFHLLVPTVAYIGQVLIEPAAYDWIKHVYYITVSFGVGQFIHGQTKLQSGATYVTIPKAEHEALLVTAAAATTGEGVVIAEPAGPVPTVIGN